MASLLAPARPADRGCLNVGSTNGIDAYTLNDAGEEQWLVHDERTGIRPLDREQFDAILQDLLS